MFVRGSGSGNEYRRVDISPYKGIVIQTNDPLKLNRVKVFIPELSNQPYDDWIEKFETFILKSPGINCNPKNRI
jgi:ABC-type lipoprotein release transport system permease subunit